MTPAASPHLSTSDQWEPLAQLAACAAEPPYGFANKTGLLEACGSPLEPTRTIWPKVRSRGDVVATELLDALHQLAVRGLDGWLGLFPFVGFGVAVLWLVRDVPAQQRRLAVNSSQSRRLREQIDVVGPDGRSRSELACTSKRVNAPAK